MQPESEALLQRKRELQQQNIRRICDIGEELMEQNAFEVGGKYRSDSFCLIEDDDELILEINVSEYFPDSHAVLMPSVVIYANDIPASSLLINVIENPDKSMLAHIDLHTEEFFRSRGYAQALVSLGLSLGRKVIDFEPFKDKQIVVEFIDHTAAYEDGDPHKGLSSYIAKQLGYKPSGFTDFRGKQLPVFRFQFR
jgi:hypothetical protein